MGEELSDYLTWSELDDADEWLVFSENIGSPDNQGDVFFIHQ